MLAVELPFTKHSNDDIKIHVYCTVKIKILRNSSLQNKPLFSDKYLYKLMFMLRMIRIVIEMHIFST